MLDKRSEKFDRKLDATLETKLGEVGDGRDISEVCDTLRKVESEMRQLETKSLSHGLVIQFLDFSPRIL